MSGIHFSPPKILTETIMPNRKSFIIYFFTLLATLHATSQTYTVRDGSATPYIIEDTRNRINIYVVNGVDDVEISYTSSSSSHQWYRYNTRFLDREEISCSQVGTTSTIRNVQDGYGYCVYREGEMLNAVWIIDYAQHPFNLSSLTIETESACNNQVSLKGEPELDELYYMTPSGERTIVSRDIPVSFTSLEWSDDDVDFLEVDRTETVSSLSETISEVLIPTTFCAEGDRFSEHFGMDASICSEEYSPYGLELHVDTALVINEADNMYSSGSGLSAPATVHFTAIANDPVAYLYRWQIYPSSDKDNIMVYFTEPEVEYTFNTYGTYTAEIQVSDATGTCTVSDEVTLTISESYLDVPNAFSPGTTPGVNDEFRVVYRSLVRFSCWIFNRWGQQLYHWTDPAQGWDGKRGGKYVSPGVYFYVIEAEGSDGIIYNKKGHINIMRPRTVDDQINSDGGI